MSGTDSLHLGGSKKRIALGELRFLELPPCVNIPLGRNLDLVAQRPARNAALRAGYVTSGLSRPTHGNPTCKANPGGVGHGSAASAR